MSKKNIPNQEMYNKIYEWLEEYHSTDDAKKKARLKTLIVANMVPVVKHLARTIARRETDPIEDLTQAGSLGLLKAIDRFSKDKNDNFRVYAGYLIIGEMKHYLRDKLNTIRVPRHIQELCLRINNFTFKEIEKLLEIGIPYIFMDFYDEHNAVDSVVSDSVYGSYLLTDYLIKKGHKKIGFVGDIYATSSILDRYIGYYKALVQNHLEY